MRDTLKDVDVLILCGGKGKRLRKISRSVPKPMAKIGQRPFLDILISHLSNFGFRRFILSVGYKSRIIEDYYLKNHKKGLKIIFSREKKPLGTGGGLKHAQKAVQSQHLFVLNGDSYCRFDPHKFLSFHKKNKSLVSILLRKENNCKDYGEIRISSGSRILAFNEKNDNAKNCWINAGIYIFDQRIFKLMPSIQKFSLERDFFPNLCGRDIFGYKTNGLFIDIGTPKRYLKAQRIFKDKQYG